LILNVSPIALTCTFCFIFYFVTAAEGKDYFGKVIGNFNNYAHKVLGKVFAVDEDTIFIKGFSYDGLGPGRYNPIPHALPPLYPRITHLMRKMKGKTQKCLISSKL